MSNNVFRLLVWACIGWGVAGLTLAGITAATGEVVQLKLLLDLMGFSLGVGCLLLWAWWRKT